MRVLAVSLMAVSLMAMSLMAVTLVSVQEEIEIGRAANEQVRARVPELHDATVASYVRDVGKRLVSKAPGAKYPYSFAVADLPEINAFSLPGGPVWVNRGVLSKAGNESQMAAVLAHEIAHIAQRHGAERLTQGMVAQWGLGLLGALLGGVFLKFNRTEEREADRVGMTILTGSGWAGQGMVELFEMLGREAGRDRASVSDFLSSHPSPQDRIENLSQVSRRLGGRHDSARFRSMKARIGRLPASRPGHNR